MKQLKIPLPSKNFKNAIAQSDTLALGQLVANLNIANGCVTLTTRTPACNDTSIRVSDPVSVFNQNYWI